MNPHFPATTTSKRQPVPSRGGGRTCSHAVLIPLIGMNVQISRHTSDHHGHARREKQRRPSGRRSEFPSASFSQTRGAGAIAKHPSVAALLNKYPGKSDPKEIIRDLARTKVAQAKKHRWSGPPFCAKEFASILADELDTLKRELMKAEVRLAKARATVVSAEIDIKILNARLKAVAQ